MSKIDSSLVTSRLVITREDIMGQIENIDIQDKEAIVDIFIKVFPYILGKFFDATNVYEKEDIIAEIKQLDNEFTASKGR